MLKQPRQTKEAHWSISVATPYTCLVFWTVPGMELSRETLGGPCRPGNSCTFLTWAHPCLCSWRPLSPDGSQCCGGHLAPHSFLCPGSTSGKCLYMYVQTSLHLPQNWLSTTLPRCGYKLVPYQPCRCSLLWWSRLHSLRRPTHCDACLWTASLARCPLKALCCCLSYGPKLDPPSHSLNNYKTPNSYTLSLPSSHTLSCATNSRLCSQNGCPATFLGHRPMPWCGLDEGNGSFLQTKVRVSTKRCGHHPVETMQMW